MSRLRRRRVATILTIFVAGLLTFGSTLADEVLDEVSAFDIPDQSLDQALLEFSKQADVQIIMAAETTRDLEAVGINGQQRNRDVLERLLADRGLKYSEHNNRTIAVFQGAIADEGGDSDSGNRTAAGATPRPVMMAQAVAEQSKTNRKAAIDSDEDETKRTIEEIIVTGTNIRGIAPESSPVYVFDRQDIEASGAATAQDFIKSVPQNFGGGANESYTFAPDNGSAGLNDANGSGVNLRGLGSGSTLVLLNGRRIAPSSDIGGFTDISMIPASAIERVEILTDGASSIYGADAVAGVTNFILSDDFDGAEVSLRYGTVTEGDLNEYRASLTGGKNWRSGNGLVVYEYYKRDNLDAGDRDFSKDFLLPNDLLPKQERHSIIGSTSHQLARNLNLSSDILFSRRESQRRFTGLIGAPTGVVFENDIVSDNLNIGALLSWNIVSDWYLDMSGSYGEVNTEFESIQPGNISTRETNADLWTMEAKASGTIFQLPGGPAKLAFGGHFRQESLLNLLEGTTTRRDGDRDVYAFFGEAFFPIVGSNNARPGVRRLELNISGRFDHFSDFGSAANPKVGLLWSPTDQLRVRGSFGTSFKPPTIGQTGASDRGATATHTSFIYNVLGIEPADPSIADVVLLLPFGTSEDLDAETSRAFSGGFDYDVDHERHGVSLSATYFDITFEDRLGNTPVPNAQHVLTVFNTAFHSPQLFPEGTVLYLPSRSEVDAVLDSLNTPAVHFEGADPADAAIISFASLTRNLSRTEVRGIDFEAIYSLDADFGHLIFGINGTYLIDFAQQAAVTTPLIQLLDTQYNPLNLNLRGHIGYSHDGFSTNLFVNHADDYRVDNTDTGAPIDSWTTIDASVSFGTEDRYDSPVLDNMFFRLNVRNLFNADPPAAPSFLSSRLLGFDPTNASPLGRFISFEITKAF